MLICALASSLILHAVMSVLIPWLLLGSTDWRIRSIVQSIGSTGMVERVNFYGITQTGDAVKESQNSSPKRY